MPNTTRDDSKSASDKPDKTRNGTSTAKDATEYYQRQLDEQIQEVAALRRRLSIQKTFRAIPAYGFKLLALLGGVAVATGLNEAAAQAVGVAIAVVVILDGVFSNHTRLLAVAAGARTAKQLLARIAHEHRVSLGPILEMKRKNEDEAAAALNDLNARLVKEIGERRQEIEDRIDEADIRALEALSLDEQRKRKT